MKIEEITLKHQGKSIQGKIALPDNLTEAIKMLTDQEVFRLFLKAFRAEAMQGIKGRKPRKKRFVKVDLEQIPQELRHYLLSQAKTDKRACSDTPAEEAEESPLVGEP